MIDKQTLTEWDKKHLWHPFTQMKDWLDGEPLIIESGDGCYLIDVEGKRYIDGVSSLWVLVHGHGKKEMLDALKKQADKLCHSTLLGLASVPSVVLAKKLVDITPKGLSRVFYSDNGSTSVEIALKMAYQYWQQKGEKQRKKFIAFTNAYHGDTIGAVSMGGIDLFHKVYRPLLFSTIRSPSPYCYRCPLKLDRDKCSMECVDVFKETVAKNADRTCAVVLEPLVQGAAGMLMQPPGFLKAIADTAKEHGLLFIADEVATGFGRTGNLFACNEEGVEPDFMCLAKGITGGYLPLAATVTTEAVFQGFMGEFHDFKTFFHGHTYTGNALASAVAVENLDLFKREGLVEKVKVKAGLMKERLRDFRDLPHVGEVRQKGFMVGIELVKNKKTKRAYQSKEKTGHRVIMEARKRGVIIRPLGDVIVLMPPLAIDNELLHRLLDVTFESIEVVTGA
jgi:adenosylmethionine---8-amino-7-oxononanoate aminotransferase